MKMRIGMMAAMLAAGLALAAGCQRQEPVRTATGTDTVNGAAGRNAPAEAAAPDRRAADDAAAMPARTAPATALPTNAPQD